MAEEKEILSILSEGEYGDVRSRLKRELGKPKVQRRLSLQADNYEQTDVDTRIRITDGEAELIQKVGNWENITRGEARTEISIELPADEEIIAGLYRIIRNLMRGPKIENIVMQFESYIWEREGFEIKLTYQFGKSDAYNCEVEVLDDSLDPEDLANKYDIPVHLPAQTEGFWRKWNERVNLNANELSERELLGIIGRYL